MHTYEQSTGRWLHHGVELARGYSGVDDGDGVLEPGEGKNDPAAQEQQNVGPIPRGRWRILGPPFTHQTAGPFVMRLYPLAGTETFGRAGFLIHGDSIIKPGAASRGCIILPRSVRLHIWATGDPNLEVVR